MYGRMVRCHNNKVDYPVAMSQTSKNRPWDPLAEPPLARFLRVVRHELGATIGAELTSDRSRDVLDMAQRLLDHLIVREEQLDSLCAQFSVHEHSALGCLQSILGNAGKAKSRKHGSVAEQLEQGIAELMPRLPGLSSAARADAWRTLKELIKSEDDFYAAIERGEIAAAQVPARAPNSELRAAEFQTYLNRRAAPGSAIEVAEINTLLGGYSKDTFILTLRGKGRPADDIVVRRDIRNGPLESSVTSEFAVLKAMFESGVPVAEPLWIEADPAVLGEPFIVTRRMPGKQLVDVKLDVAGEGTAECTRQLARVLARIHSADPRRAGVSESELKQSTQCHILRLLNQFEEQWRRRRLGPSAVVAAGLAWMRCNIPSDLPQPRIIHGDPTVRNMLFSEGQVTAMLDWETWHLGDPGEDLAYSRIDVERFMPWQEFIAEYHAQGGAPFSRDSERYWGMWVYLRGAITSVSMMDRLLIDPPADIRPAFGGPYFTRFCIRKVAEYMQTL
jgi:aminoglycoside phosphotransferase (APT) family kinase protein